ncbi:hypothetical protein [Geodermatophilus sp. URMC 63]
MVLAAAGAEPKVTPLEAFDLLEAALRSISTQIERGVSLGDIKEDVETGSPQYYQQGWSANTVQNAKTILNVALGEARKEPEVQALRMPIVLAVMTATDVEALIQGSVFDDRLATLRSDYERLRGLLEDLEVSDWTERYGQAAEDWRPFGLGTDSVAQLVSRTIGAANQRWGYTPPLSPSFFDVRRLVADRQQLQDVRERGCLVVVDLLSMCHPAVQRGFQLAMLDAYPRSAVVAIAPAHQALEPAKAVNVMLELPLSDLEFGQRLRDIFDEWFTETTDLLPLEKWIAQRVVALADRTSQQSSPLNRALFGSSGGSP